MHAFSIFVFAPVQRSLACFTRKSALEIRSLLLLLPHPCCTCSPKLATWNLFQLHKTSIDKKGSSIHANICRSDVTLQYAVVVHLGEVPDPAKGTCTKAFLVPPLSNGQCTVQVTRGVMMMTLVIVVS